MMFEKGGGDITDSIKFCFISLQSSSIAKWLCLEENMTQNSSLIYVFVGLPLIFQQKCYFEG